MEHALIMADKSSKPMYVMSTLSIGGQDTKTRCIGHTNSERHVMVWHHHNRSVIEGAKSRESKVHVMLLLKI